LIRVAGLEFQDPIIIASGIVPLENDFMNRVCENYKPSAITTKTLTLEPLEPHKPPTVIKFHDGCYMNAIGLGNPGVKALKDINIKCRLIVSIGGSSVEEITKAVSEVNSEVIELNLSSPNRKGYGESLASYVSEVTKNAKGVLRKGVRLFVKLGPWDNIIELSGKALSAGSDGLTLINTLKGLSIDIETFRPILSYGTGGISGKCLHPLAVRIIRDVYKEYEAEIIGMGGVFDWRDAIELMSVGAKLVGLGTVIIDKGFSSIIEVREGINAFLKEKGLKIENIIGIAVKK